MIIVLSIYVLIFIPFEASVSTYGILDFEFAWNQDRVEIIFSTWGIQGINKETLLIYGDFLFIVGYVSLAFGLIVLILRRSKGKIQKLGIYFAITPFLTGILDLIENINLLIMLYSPASVSTVNAFIASLSAMIKFSLLFAAVFYFIIATITVVINRIKKND